METGLQTNIPFSGDKYQSVYQCMKALMDELEGNITDKSLTIFISQLLINLKEG